MTTMMVREGMGLGKLRIRVILAGKFTRLGRAGSEW
jgi:hypothetical protein